MNTLSKNVRIGRNGRVGILKKIPRDLWPHPRYAGKSKLIERSTGSTDKAEGTKIALEMLARLEIEFSQARAELNSGDFSSPHRGRKPTSASLTQSVAPHSPSRNRSKAAEETRRDIINVAMQEFAEKGLSGARVDEIAAKTRTTKPTIYYQFGSKE